MNYEKLFSKQLLYIDSLPENYRKLINCFSIMNSCEDFDLYEINQNIRNGFESSTMSKSFKIIAKIFNDIPKTSQEMTLYRGISELTKEQFDTFSESKIINIYHYISTSLDPKIAKRYAMYGNYRILFEIEVGKGFKILPLNYDLLEVIISKDHKLLVKEIKKLRKNMYIKCVLVN